MKKILSLLFIVILLTACGNTNSYKTINATTAKELMDNGAIVIDVRTEEEYNNGHIINAVNIPLNTIDTITYGKDTVIIVYCASGVRSLEAAKKLVSLGYTSINNLDGGILNAGELMEE